MEDKEDESTESSELVNEIIPTSEDIMGDVIVDEQLKQIQEVHEIMKKEGIYSEIWTNLRTFRFLKARKFKLEDALTMIRADVKWRKEFGVDTINETFPKNKHFETLKNYWPGKFHGKDKRGLPIWCERIALVDVKGLMKVPREDLILFHVWLMEGAESFLQETSKKLGREVRSTVLIQDLTGLGLKHLNNYTAITTIQELIKIDEAHYPESLYRMYVVNTPAVFTAIYKILKPFLDPVTLSKIQVCKSSKDFLNLVVKDVDLDQVPNHLGGSCDCQKGSQCIADPGPFTIDTSS